MGKYYFFNLFLVKFITIADIFFGFLLNSKVENSFWLFRC